MGKTFLIAGVATGASGAVAGAVSGSVASFNKKGRGSQGNQTIVVNATQPGQYTVTIPTPKSGP